ncbi:zf-TFIIB domain-containing protein [Dactylosporangium sp. AC04546]|uniref:TFIIB-type zinc ribbon-containing protein n=1 Tax=Dactylosporangium sp. AC04546 TaxID=2862460 RepID=UPI001EE02D30|nr:zf-TFIIB domain-containing protein [Dactylosporangium sp. AC04546]WVK84893.1 zf-TFIIB domain-containing protein [Dactylosporangium sp. AC04546]
MQMTCPKCRGEMRQYERSGVTVDQCVECRGIFLDRGELERLTEAEATWNNNRQATPPPPAPAPGYPPQQPYTHQPSHGSHGYGSHGYGHYGHHKRHKRHKRDSFFGELFD